MEEKHVFSRKENLFTWEGKITKVEFSAQPYKNSYAIKISRAYLNRDCTTYWQVEVQQFMKNIVALEGFLKQLEYVCDCKPNKEWTAIRADWNNKLWGHKLTRSVVGAEDVYEISKRARVGCELYDVFIGRKAGGDSRFGVTFADLERESVEQLRLCLEEYIEYVKKKKGED